MYAAIIDDTLIVRSQELGDFDIDLEQVVSTEKIKVGRRWITQRQPTGAIRRVGEIRARAVGKITGIGLLGTKVGVGARIEYAYTTKIGHGHGTFTTTIRRPKKGDSR